MPNPFRFGVQCGHCEGGAAGWAALARKAEELGYSTFTMGDHLDAQFSPTVGLMAAAAATSTIRIGALTYANDYHHPVVLAKEAATLDLLSDGRLELGIGAGWMTSDYEQAGIPLDPPGTRIDRLAEAVTVLKGLFADGRVDFHGDHYEVHGLEGSPKPVQRPHPPLLIGGGGRRILSLAAREADIVGINPSMHAGVVGPEAFQHMTASAVDEKIAIVRAAAGDRLGDIELNIRAFLVNVTDDGAGARSRLSGMLGVDDEMLLTSPFALIGSPAELVERLLERREQWGFSYVIVGAEDVDKFAPVVAALAGK